MSAILPGSDDDDGDRDDEDEDEDDVVAEEEKEEEVRGTAGIASHGVLRNSIPLLKRKLSTGTASNFLFGTMYCVPRRCEMINWKLYRIWDSPKKW